MNLHSAWREVARISNVLVTAASRGVVIASLMLKRDGRKELGSVNDVRALRSLTHATPAA